MTAKLSIHQHIALTWAICAPLVFLPIVESAKRPDAGTLITWGVAFVTAIIITIPMFLRWPVFRRWYGWTDALSERQRQALAKRDLRRYYQISYNDGYVSRVVPYLKRLIWTTGGLMVLNAVLPNDTGMPVFDALMIFSIFYPMGVTLLTLLSCPLAQVFLDRSQERRK